MNSVHLSGRLVGDPVARGEGRVCAFSIAHNRNVRQPDGSWAQAPPTYVDCVGFSSIASRVLARLKKGDKVYVSGRLETQTWEQDGQRRSVLKLIVNGLESEGLFRSEIEPQSIRANLDQQSLDQYMAEHPDESNAETDRAFEPEAAVA
jgi:single-strand DNA-binding protein